MEKRMNHIRSKTLQPLFVLSLITFGFLGTLLGETNYSGHFIFPPQSKHVHSSSIVECPNGDLIAVWFHGSGEKGADDVQIQGSRLRKGKTSWEKPFVAADTPQVPDCNPIVFIDAQNRLWLVWIVVHGNRWEKSLLKYRYSEDYQNEGSPQWKWQDIILLKPDNQLPNQLKEGFNKLGYKQEMWGEYALPYDKLLIEAARDQHKRELGWMTRCLPLILTSGSHSGRILLPLYSDGFNISLMGISDDAGKTWRTSQPVVGFGNIQPTLARRKDGTLLAFMRDSGMAPQRVMVSESNDDGESWTVAQDTPLLNPGSSLAVTVLADGRWIMALNDTEQGRHQMSIALSIDEGRTWPRHKIIEKAPPKQNGFGYPTVIQSRSGRVHLTYSNSQTQGATIKHTSFDPDWLNTGTEPY